MHFWCCCHDSQQSSEDRVGPFLQTLDHSFGRTAKIDLRSKRRIRAWVRTRARRLGVRTHVDSNHHSTAERSLWATWVNLENVCDDCLTSSASNLCLNSCTVWLGSRPLLFGLVILPSTTAGTLLRSGFSDGDCDCHTRCWTRRWESLCTNESQWDRAFSERIAMMSAAQRSITSLRYDRALSKAVLARSRAHGADPARQLFQVGDVVYYWRSNGKAKREWAAHWHGLATVIGLQHESLWLAHRTTTVKCSKGHVRHATASEQ